MIPIIAVCLLFSGQAIAEQKPTVVLLHGLGRTSASMRPVAERLTEEGYRVVNIDYPSRSHEIDSLASIVIDRIRSEILEASTPLSFVTHSMGGIVLRAIASRSDSPQITRAVMIAPPHHGTEIVDRTGDWMIFEAIVGPAGQQLGTTDDSVPQQLPVPQFEFGVIAGSGEPLLGFSGILPGDDDGIVSVESTRIDGMADHIVLPYGHTALLRSTDCHDQIVAFLKIGSFQRSGRAE
jgi:triacylglycerol lipase